LRVCTAIKATGERCKAGAISGSEWCWNHDPAHAEKRRRNGSRGGRRGGRGRPQAELKDIKDRLSELADNVLGGTVDRADAAVTSQILNVYLRALSTELKIKEQEELITRMENLEQVVEANRRARYG
jgi:hypothetical protein